MIILLNNNKYLIGSFESSKWFKSLPVHRILVPMQLRLAFEAVKYSAWHCVMDLVNSMQCTMPRNKLYSGMGICFYFIVLTIECRPIAE